MTEPEVTSRKLKVSVNGFLKESAFQFQVTAVWRAHAGFYIFVKNPSVETVELFNHISMWGGPTKSDRQLGGAWEFPEDMRQFLSVFIRRTRSSREPDLVKFEDV